MSKNTFEIRVCISCGLRYPLVSGRTLETRCPLCIGTTRVAHTSELILEPDPIRSSDTLPDSFGPWDGQGVIFAVLLDNVRSAWNVGSILRSADGFGILHAYLCGITPTPENDAVQKTALGAEESVTWSHHKDAVRLVRGLKAEGWRILALEDDLRAIPITSSSINGYGASRKVLILGNEVTGVDPELLPLCDDIYYIPMLGGKKSLNVAIAFSVAAFALQK